jgi:hypothetical protein
MKMAKRTEIRRSIQENWWEVRQRHRYDITSQNNVHGGRNANVPSFTSSHLYVGDWVLTQVIRVENKVLLLRLNRYMCLPG